MKHLIRIALLCLLPIIGYGQLGVRKTDTAIVATVDGQIQKWKTWDYTKNALIQNQRATYQTGGFKLDSSSSITIGKLSADGQSLDDHYSRFPIKSKFYQSVDNFTPVNPAYNRHVYGVISLNETGFTTTRLGGITEAMTAQAIIKKTNTADWTESNYPSLIGVHGSIVSLSGSSGTIRRGASYYGHASGSSGSGALIDEAIGIELDASGSGFNYFVGLRATDLNKGTLGNTGIYLGFDQSAYTATGNWGIYDITGYDSKTSGQWKAKSYITDYNNSSSITDWVNYKSVSPIGSGAITNMSHFNATENATRATNNTNFLVGTQPTGNWNIYTNSSYNNYLGTGNTEFGGEIKAALPAYSSGDIKTIGYNSTNDRMETIPGVTVVGSGLMKGKTDVGSIISYTVPADGYYKIEGTIYVTAMTTNSIRSKMSWTNASGQPVVITGATISAAVVSPAQGVLINGLIFAAAGTTINLITENVATGGTQTYDITAVLISYN